MSCQPSPTHTISQQGVIQEVTKLKQKEITEQSKSRKIAGSSRYV